MAREWMQELTRHGLRVIRDEDAGSFMRQRNDPAVHRFLDGAYPLDAAEALRKIQEGRGPNERMFAVIDMAFGEFIGTTRLAEIDWDGGTCWSDVVIGVPALWRGGRGPETKSLLYAFAFERLGMSRVTASAMLESIEGRNRSSIGMQLRFGMQHSRDYPGTFRGSAAVRREFAITASQWREKHGDTSWITVNEGLEAPFGRPA